MIKQTLTYLDFNEEWRTEDFYFHFSTAELAEMQLGQAGGMEEWLKTIVASDDREQILAEFKKMIINSYGQRTPDGKSFIKNKELREAFAGTNAYSDLYMKMITDPEFAAEFANGIMPKIEPVRKDERPQPQDRLPTQQKDPVVIEETAALPPTNAELEDMTAQDLAAFKEWQAQQVQAPDATEG